MADHATPNLPSRDFAATAAFYAPAGFIQAYRSDGWMILERDELVLEFFAFPDLDPLSSSFGCCLRLDDLDGFYAVLKACGIPERDDGQPRLQPPRREPWGGRVGFLIDPDGSLLHLVQS